MNGFLISMSCKKQCFHLPQAASISFRATNNKVFVDEEPLGFLQYRNSISDNFMLIYCKFEQRDVPDFLYISAKKKKYSKKNILVNDDNIIMNKSFGQCFDVRDNASEKLFFGSGRKKSSEFVK